MQIKREQLTPTKLKLSLTADQTELDTIKQHVIAKLSKNIKVQGFRAGKAPAHLIEKNIDPAVLQSEFVDHAINDLYVGLVEHERLRPVAQPNVNITKFVPFTTLEFTAEVEVVGKIKLANYKAIKVATKPVTVSAKDIEEVLTNLQTRGADKAAVKRAAKDGDEVVIDFVGTDAKTKDAIAGADGKDYPLQLGSKSFIPGFEEELIGLKAGATKTFMITFPDDYGAPELQSRKVNFAVTVHTVNQLVKAKLDDDFAATIGSFKTVQDLKDDIKKQLKAERQQEAQRQFDNELLEKITAKSDVPIPQPLVEEEIDRLEEEEQRNTAYRGQTWQEHLDAEGVDATEHRERQRESAEMRVKAGLVLGEIAEAEKVTVTPEDLEVRIMLMKSQYTDDAMLAELDKPENRRDIMSRMITEKTLDKLRAGAK